MHIEINLELIMAFFALIGAADRIFGNKLGIGKEFEKGVLILGSLCMSMIGMLVMAPVIAGLLRPLLQSSDGKALIDPSIVPSILLADDMGGAALSSELAIDPQMGFYNGLIVASMTGCTISFIIPFGLETVEKRLHREMITGILIGMAVIPIGTFAGGLVAGIPIFALLMDQIPILLVSGLIAFGLLKFPDESIRIFKVIGFLIKMIITVGLAASLFTFLTHIVLIPGLGTLEDGAAVCVNSAAVMCGAFPMVYVVSRILDKPIKRLGQRSGINTTSTVGLVATLATSITTFGIMKDMDSKGIVLNSAFAVCAAGTFSGHLAFIIAFNRDFIAPLIVCKILAGVVALFLANLLYEKMFKSRWAN